MMMMMMMMMIIIIIVIIIIIIALKVDYSLQTNQARLAQIVRATVTSVNHHRNVYRFPYFLTNG